MKVAFRVDASPSMGLGHLMRCLALAQALEDEHIESVFFVSEETVQYCKSRHDWVGQVIPVAAMQHEDELQWIAKQANERALSTCILDGYHFDQAYRKQLKSIFDKLAVFDDLNNSGQLYADVVINYAANADKLDYPSTAPDAQYCFGEKYRVLRKEFREVETDNWENRRGIVINFGGSDPTNLTLKVLSALAATNFDQPIRVVTGGAYLSLAELTYFIQNSQISVQHIHNCQNMADVFVNAKLVVSAAGGTQYELLACATPSILMVVADNQTFAAEQGDKAKQKYVSNINALMDEVSSMLNDEYSLQQLHRLLLNKLPDEFSDNLVEQFLLK